MMIESTSMTFDPEAALPQVVQLSRGGSVFVQRPFASDVDRAVFACVVGLDRVNPYLMALDARALLPEVFSDDDGRVSRADMVESFGALLADLALDVAGEMYGGLDFVRAIIDRCDDYVSRERVQ